MKQYLYTEEMNAKPCISVPRNWWTGMILSGSLNIRWKRNSRRPHILPRCTEMSRYPGSRLQELMKKLYRALDCGIVLGKNKVIHLKGEEEDGCGKEPEVQEDGLCGLEKYCMKSNFSRAKEEMIRLLYKWDKEERPQIWVEGMVHKISYILQKYRSGKGWNREEEFLLEDAFLYSENVQQLADNLAEILFKTPEEEADFLKGYTGILQ